LWLDVFQKIKALGYNGVSFYVDWALVEGKQGDFSAEGIFAWEPFFEAATKAGIYLIAVSQSCYYSSCHFSILLQLRLVFCVRLMHRICQSA